MGAFYILIAYRWGYTCSQLEPSFHVKRIAFEKTCVRVYWRLDHAIESDREDGQFADATKGSCRLILSALKTEGP